MEEVAGRRRNLLKEKAMKTNIGMVAVRVLATVALTGAAARADDGPVADADYLAGAITHAATEVRAGKLALKRAQSEEVRQFARKLLDQQAAFDPDLEALAVDHKLAVLSIQTDGWQASQSRLGELSGDGFDREALKLLAGDLKQWIDLSRRSASGDDAAESELAIKMLPVLRKRLGEAKRLLKTVPAAGAAK
jgi:putative membrane protein